MAKMQLFWDRERHSLRLERQGQLLLRSDADFPMVFVGHGQESVDMYRGNYQIRDYVTERRSLQLESVADCGEEEGKSVWQLTFDGTLRAKLVLSDDLMQLHFREESAEVNRFWLRIPADAGEHCYGMGEQYSYLDLRGRHYPLWTGEPGVGRDKSTYVTWRSDVENKAGGDYYGTYYPEQTFVSSRRYYLHIDSTAYADFDFRHPDFHELQVWEVPETVRMECADSFPELLQKETAFLGRQPALPDWVYNGLVLGVQGGSERSFGIAEDLMKKGVPLAGVWCQDWCGKRVTSFGKRLQWDWHYSRDMYPDLPEKIRELHEKNVRFLGYANPYLVNDGMLYKEGSEKGYMVKDAAGRDYLVDFGEFWCGIPDLTNPEAVEWFKSVLKKYMLDIGIDGWMADFGEYLPTEGIALHNQASPMVEHNHWPVMWAKVNDDAVREAGKLGEVVWFMRAGGTGTQRHCALLWAGDQSVDFSRHDGLCTAMIATLGAGLTGVGISHSDIGGFTSLFGNRRTKEVFFRWAEMAVFTPFMRTHESNRPEENYQFYEDEDGIRRMARLVNIYRKLAPYSRAVIREYEEQGLPAQRALFIHYDRDERAYTEQFEYLYGRDLLVAPVWQAGKTEWTAYLPEDEWVHLWTGKCYCPGDNTVSVPMGYPAVFYRKSSRWAALFAELAQIE